MNFLQIFFLMTEEYITGSSSGIGGFHRPEWVPDESAKRCKGCKTEFSIFTRRVSIFLSFGISFSY